MHTAVVLAPCLVQFWATRTVSERGLPAPTAQDGDIPIPHHSPGAKSVFPMYLEPARIAHRHVLLRVACPALMRSLTLTTRTGSRDSVPDHATVDVILRREIHSIANFNANRCGVRCHYLRPTRGWLAGIAMHRGLHRNTATRSLIRPSLGATNWG